ncbi:MAG TPA: PfkB family carbohydrate kinase [Dermatophilaceae bacterium]|nr:PfkB family carbohydrate kinase [Dermatophilaceae bacterium]
MAGDRRGAPPVTGRVVVIGSLNVDIVALVERLPRPGETVLGRDLTRWAGGKGANQAVAARAAGAEVAMVGCVGADEPGRAYLRRLTSLGIDTTAVQVELSEATGHALINVDFHGENSIVVVPGANSRLSAAAVGAAVSGLTPQDVLLMQLEIPTDLVTRAARRARDAGARVVLNMAPYAPLPTDVVAAADPVIVNEHEALLLADADQAADSLVVTFGAAGAAWGGRQRPGPVVAANDVIDTTGAGDAFCGALAAALAHGRGRGAALDAALSAGAAAVQHPGAQPDGRLP